MQRISQWALSIVAAVLLGGTGVARAEPSTPLLDGMRFPPVGEERVISCLITPAFRAWSIYRLASTYVTGYGMRPL